MRHLVFLSLVFMFAACGPETEKKTADTASAPADSAWAKTAAPVANADTPVVALPLIRDGIDMRIKNGDTTYVIDNLKAYDTILLKAVECPLVFDGIPEWTGKDSFPPDWATRSIAKKIEFIESFPGSFNQMCADDSGIDEAPHFAYPSGIRWTYSMTADRFFELRKIRSAVIAYLLQARKGKALTDQDLVIITDLNAVEFIPRLLLAEQALRPMALANTKRRLKTKMSNDAGGWRLSNAVIESHQQIMEALIHLLRQEKYKPLLDSEMEKNYAKALREESARDYKGQVSAYEQLDEKDRGATYVDPVYRLPVHQWFSTEVPFTRENISFIARCAAGYWKETPQHVKQKSGERMAIAPVER